MGRRRRAAREIGPAQFSVDIASHGAIKDPPQANPLRDTGGLRLVRAPVALRLGIRRKCWQGSA
jgi:hypothetical protein